MRALPTCAAWIAFCAAKSYLVDLVKRGVVFERYFG